MKKIQILVCTLFVAVSTPVWAISIGGVNVKLPGQNSNPSSSAPVSTSQPNSGASAHACDGYWRKLHSGKTICTKGMQPQEVMWLDVKEHIFSQYDIQGDWIQTGNMTALKALLESKYGMPRPSKNNGYQWILKPAGDNSGRCLEFRISQPESNRVHLGYGLNEPC